MRLTGSEIFLKSLQAEGVHTIFGHPGGVVLHAYDVLADYPLRHILCRHEQVAMHAVEGFYKASGQTGTAFVTSGPGATNTITGLTDALARLDGWSTVLLRPWLQDFSWRHRYGPDQVRAEIRAAEEIGVGGFMLWNASNIYTEDAIR